MTDVSIDDVNNDICFYHYMTGPSRDIVPHESYNKFCFLKKHLSKKILIFVLINGYTKKMGTFLV
jgi:hypothetical protein